MIQFILEKIVKSYKLLIVFAKKNAIKYVWEGSN